MTSRKRRLYFFDDTHSGYGEMNRVTELKKLGSHIRAIRMEKNMTQMQFAKACVLDRNYIGMLERGERNPTYITLLKLSEQLGVSVSQLID